MDPFQVLKKVSIAPFPNLLTSSNPDILQDFSYFPAISSTKNTLLQNVLAIFAPPFAKFLHQPPGGPWCPIPAAMPEHTDAQLCAVRKVTGAL